MSSPIGRQSREATTDQLT